MLDSFPISRQDFEALLVEPSLSEVTGSPELLAAFNKRSISVTCREDEVLFRMGEPGNSVYLVRSGEVGLILPFSHSGAVGFRAKSNSIVGLPAAFSNAPYSMSAIAWKGSELGVMGRDRFCDLIASDHSLAMEVLRILAAETRAARLAVVDARSKVQGETSP